MPLNVDFSKRVNITPEQHRWAASPQDGAELLLLEGGLAEGADGYARGSWVRLPAGEQTDFVASPKGATLYLKTGHLAPARTAGPW
ncbi:MAG: cupin domain-containing protein [Polyangiaceae bacterium]|jgi:ChrR Cupin-like domain|nr:cupin domain-containing protein [Polyangiaceae bacterium]